MCFTYISCLFYRSSILDSMYVYTLLAGLSTRRANLFRSSGESALRLPAGNDADLLELRAREAPMLPAIATPERDMVKTPPSKAVRLRGKAVTHTELHKAVLRDNVDLVRRVLLRGAGPWGHANARDWWGRTPLHRACERGNVSILVELMTRGGADPNIQENQWLRAPLHIASERNLLEVAAVLLAHGSDPNQADRQHSTPLMLATCEGHTDMCELLLKAGANASSRNNEGLTPLHVACRDGQRDIVCLLCDVIATQQCCWPMALNSSLQRWYNITASPRMRGWIH